MDHNDQELILEASSDVVVSRLTKLQGKVRKGDEIAILTSTRLEWFNSQLQSTKEDLDIQDRFFTELRREDCERVLDERVKSATESLLVAKDVYRKAEYLSSIGAMDPSDLASIHKQVTQVEVQLSGAQRNQVTSLGNFQDMKSRISIARERLKINQSVYEEATKRLKIVSPADGWFVAAVGQGGFVLAGDPVGVVHLGVTEPLKQTLTCAAPDDVTVSSLMTVNGEIEKGETIALMSSSRLKQFETRVQCETEDLKIRRRFFTDKILDSLRIDGLKNIVDQAVTSASQALNQAKHYESVKCARVFLGVINVVEASTSITDRLAAEVQLASAQLDKTQFPKKVKDLTDRLNSTEARLKRETKICDELKAQMILVAAISQGSKAQFVASVGEGGFVQCGDPVGVLIL